MNPKPRAWVVSDTHFGHVLLADGVKRPWTDIESMNAALVERWNSVVAPQDRVYHLGDVAINRKWVSVIGQCHGRKVLIKGNHDTHKLREYLPYFDDIRACKVYGGHGGVILTHIPVHESQLQRFPLNVHGHLHSDVVTRTVRMTSHSFMTVPDPNYRNVCVEHTNYTPLLLDEILP